MSVDKIVDLWLDAEEELRNGNDEKCLDLKEEFSNEFSKLSLDDKKEVTEYLDSVAG
jgi:hypothetical protein